VIGHVERVDDVAAAFADLVVRERPRSMALSGGETARRCYEALAARSGVDWPSMVVLFGDERQVPIDHADSNEGMAREELLDHVPIGTVLSLAEMGAAAYEVALRELGAIDLVHLGLGPDGHTASLFPGSGALAEQRRLVVAAPAGCAPFVDRLTFTIPALELARHVVFTVAGESKRDIWRRVLAGEPLPATTVRAGRVTWIVDRSLDS
jgi:6-phosphogluconolactonase